MRKKYISFLFSASVLAANLENMQMLSLIFAQQNFSFQMKGHFICLYNIQQNRDSMLDLDFRQPSWVAILKIM